MDKKIKGKVDQWNQEYGYLSIYNFNTSVKLTYTVLYISFHVQYLPSVISSLVAAMFESLLDCKEAYWAWNKFVSYLINIQYLFIVYVKSY